MCPVEKLIADMDAAGIDKAVVLGIGYLPWKPYDPENGAYVQSIVQKWPDRLIGFFTANPLGGDAEVRRFERAVTGAGPERHQDAPVLQLRGPQATVASGRCSRLPRRSVFRC